jgi:hypothetical protein
VPEVPLIEEVWETKSQKSQKSGNEIGMYLKISQNALFGTGHGPQHHRWLGPLAENGAVVVLAVAQFLTKFRCDHWCLQKLSTDWNSTFEEKNNYRSMYIFSCKNKNAANPMFARLGKGRKTT